MFPMTYPLMDWNPFALSSQKDLPSEEIKTEDTLLKESNDIEF